MGAFGIETFNFSVSFCSMEALHTARVKVCLLHVATSASSDILMQFGKPFSVKVGALPKERLQQVTSPYFEQQGPKQYCWLGPGEDIAGATLNHGAFAYVMDEGSVFVFPVV